MKLRPLNIAIVGRGFGARVLAPCLNYLDEIEVVGCRSHSSPHDVESHQRRLIGQDPLFEDVVRHPDIDLIWIATPPFSHKEYLLTLAQSDKSVICEKPLALDLLQGFEIARAFEAKTRPILGINHQLRFDPIFSKVKQLLNDEESIGNPQHVIFTYLSDAGLTPRNRDDWWLSKDLGGGQLYALGSHLIDLANNWFGSPESVFANLSRPVSSPSDSRKASPTATSDQTAALSLSYKSGLKVQITTSCIATEHLGFQLIILGDRGTITLDHDGVLRLSSIADGARSIPIIDPLSKEPVVGENLWRRAVVRFGLHLQETLAGGKTFLGATLQDGMNVQKILDAARQSDKQGSVIHLSDSLPAQSAATAISK